MASSSAGCAPRPDRDRAADRRVGLDATAGVVSSLGTTPVKGLRIRVRDEITLERSGARGNRLFYLIDESAQMVNGKQIGPLSSVVGDYDERTGDLAMTFPDGEFVGSAELFQGGALAGGLQPGHDQAAAGTDLPAVQQSQQSALPGNLPHR